VCKVTGYNDSRTHRTAMGTHMWYGITQCYLPPDRGNIPTFISAN